MKDGYISAGTRTATLTIRKTIQRIQTGNGTRKTRLVITDPKSTRSRRTIAIPKCLIKMLLQFKSDDGTFLLTGSDKPMEPMALQYRFSRLLKKPELPHIHYYALRHRFSTSAIELGFDVKTLSEILGHSSVELTTTIYCHEFQKANAMASEAISDVIDFSAPKENTDISNRGNINAV